jgi:hypothetical protein
MNPPQHPVLSQMNSVNTVSSYFLHFYAEMNSTIPIWVEFNSVAIQERSWLTNPGATSSFIVEL